MPTSKCPIIRFALAAGAPLLACAPPSDSGITPTPGSGLTPAAANGWIERLDPALDALVPPDVQIEVLAGGFDWIEGPVWLADPGFLLFSDVPRNVVYRWREGMGVDAWLEPSGYTGSTPRGGEPGSNGLALDAHGDLLLCQHGDRRVARLERAAEEGWSALGARFTTLAATDHNGRRFHSPNDLVIDSAGRIYFTDPPYGLANGPDSSDREVDYQGVYRRDPDGSVELLTNSLSRPNGIALSPDQRTLYVSNSDPSRAVWLAYPLLPNGSLGEERVFFDATSAVGPEAPGLPDGMALDHKGNLFATGPGGVWVFGANGLHLGTIRLPQASGNCAFGENGTSLFITSDDRLLRVRLSTRGLWFE